jgi:hypothetical protein
MSARRLPPWAAPLLAASLGVGVGSAVDRRAPPPSADVARGSEQAFLHSAYPRELTRQGPQRWTQPAAGLRYERLAPGPVVIELHLRAYAAPLHIFVNGAPVATWRGERDGLLAGRVGPDGRLEVAWTTAGRAAGGRVLGVLFERATVRPAPDADPTSSWRVPLLFAGLALLGVLGALLAGCHVGVALGGATALLAVQAAALLPFGLVRSPYADQLTGLLVGGVVLAAVSARLCVPARGAGRGWAWGAVLLAWVLQGVVATAPLMVVSDAVFHANKLEAVARGDFFPTSITQHATPFRFPYGVSFYALLAPLSRLGFDPVWLVRAGAGTASVLASIALFGLLAARPRRAGLAVIALQLLPATFEIYSYGNLSNVFAQALTVAFFAWWAGRAWGGGALGAGLLAAGCLAHFSGLVVLGVLTLALVGVRRLWPLPEALSSSAPPAACWRDRRVWAALVGLTIAALYYGQFLGLMLEQWPRLREGGGSGRTPGPGLLAALQHQVSWALARFGWPAMLVALLGWPRRVRASLDRDLLAFWAAGGLLAVCALVSPLEVRYLYALTAPLAVAAAEGLERAWCWACAASAPRRWAMRAALSILALAQVGLLGRELYEAVFLRYRL